MLVKLILILKTLATPALTKFHIIKINCGQTSVVSEMNETLQWSLKIQCIKLYKIQIRIMSKVTEKLL